MASGSSLQLNIPLSEAGSASCLRYHHRCSAEILFTSGQVHTVNSRNDIVEAVAVDGGRILALGSSTEIRALASPGIREIALGGRSLLPGSIDAHCQLTSLGMSMVSIDCKARGMQIVVGGEVV